MSARFFDGYPDFPEARGCSACNGKCPTPEACQLPIATATKPPRAAFWLERLLLRLRIALLRWNRDCVIDEREFYEACGQVGPLYLLNSYAQQRQLMTQIRTLEHRL